MVEMVSTKPLCDMGWWEVRDRREGSARGSGETVSTSSSPKLVGKTMSSLGVGLESMLLEGSGQRSSRAGRESEKRAKGLT